MGIEILFAYMVLIFVLGPGTVLYGVLIVLRRRVRLSRGKVLDGWKAVVAGFVAMCAGAGFTYFLWYMARFFPH